MDVCKVLDLTPGIEMTSWGTVHFPEEKRVMEWVVNVIGGKWRSLRYGTCLRAPAGGFAEVRAGQERLIEELSRAYRGSRFEVVCKENASEDEVLRLVLGELPHAKYPHSIEKEQEALRLHLEVCGRPAAKVKSSRRFEIEGR
jgi:hypothetical protein